MYYTIFRALLSHFVTALFTISYSLCCPNCIVLNCVIHFWVPARNKRNFMHYEWINVAVFYCHEAKRHWLLIFYNYLGSILLFLIAHIWICNHSNKCAHSKKIMIITRTFFFPLRLMQSIKKQGTQLGCHDFPASSRLGEIRNGLIFFFMAV